MAGRKQDNIWLYFDRYELEETVGWKARCKLCIKEMQSPDTTLFVKEKRSKMTHISEYVMKISKSESELLDLQIARYTYGTNTPFVAVEHPGFIKLIKLLCPGYLPLRWI